jgi:hypothetical protein
MPSAFAAIRIELPWTSCLLSNPIDYLTVGAKRGEWVASKDYLGLSYAF